MNFKVKIIYKSGKVEIVEIPMKDYVKALVSLVNEQRVLKVQII